MKVTTASSLWLRISETQAPVEIDCMIEVILEPGIGRVELAPGQTLMEAGRQLTERGQTAIEAPCGGKGHCGQCRVIAETR